MVDRLHEENRLDNSDYCTIHDGLSEIEPLRDRDEVLEELWSSLELSYESGNGMYREPFMGWDAGIHRKRVWQLV